MCTKQDLRAKSGTSDDSDVNLIILDRYRVGVIVALAMATVVVTVSIVPIYILRQMTSPSSQVSGSIITVLLVFILLYSTALVLCTGAKRHEILISVIM